MERKDREAIAKAFNRIEDIVLLLKGNNKLRAAAFVVDLACTLLQNVMPGERRVS